VPFAAISSGQTATLTRLFPRRILEQMVIPGRVHNGVIAIEGGVSLPEGLEVAVVVPAKLNAVADVLSNEERSRLQTIMDNVASLPNENPDETFSGADHDHALYGEP
jgi:hypothetical protein